jgi:hypothetical protein
VKSLPQAAQETSPPYIVGGKKYKRLSAVHRAIVRVGGVPKDIHDNVLQVLWAEAKRTTQYPVEIRGDGTVIHDLQFDL